MLLLFTDVLFSIIRALSLYKVYGNNDMLVLNETSLNSINALLVVSYLFYLKFLVKIPANRAHLLSWA